VNFFRPNIPQPFCLAAHGVHFIPAARILQHHGTENMPSRGGAPAASGNPHSAAKYKAETSICALYFGPGTMKWQLASGNRVGSEIYTDEEEEAVRPYSGAGWRRRRRRRRHACASPGAAGTSPHGSSSSSSPAATPCTPLSATRVSMHCTPMPLCRCLCVTVCL
jgi:hypothetical protein